MNVNSNYPFENSRGELQYLHASFGIYEPKLKMRQWTCILKLRIPFAPSEFQNSSTNIRQAFSHVFSSIFKISLVEIILWNYCPLLPKIHDFWRNSSGILELFQQFLRRRTTSPRFSNFLRIHSEYCWIFRK